MYDHDVQNVSCNSQFCAWQITVATAALLSPTEMQHMLDDAVYSVFTTTCRIEVFAERQAMAMPVSV